MGKKSIRLTIVLALLLSMALSLSASAMTIKTSSKMTEGTAKKCQLALNAYTKVALDIISGLKDAYSKDLISIIQGANIDLSKSPSFNAMKKRVTKQIKKLNKQKFSGVSNDMKKALQLSESMGKEVLELLEETSRPLSLTDAANTAKSALSSIRKLYAKLVKSGNKALSPYGLKIAKAEEVSASFDSAAGMLANLPV